MEEVIIAHWDIQWFQKGTTRPSSVILFLYKENIFRENNGSKQSNFRRSSRSFIWTALRWREIKLLQKLHLQMWRSAFVQQIQEKLGVSLGLTWWWVWLKKTVGITGPLRGKWGITIFPHACPVIVLTGYWVTYIWMTT